MTRISSENRATAVGLLAPLLWAMSVGVMRTVTESAGVTAGVALVNALSAILLIAVLGVPKLTRFPIRYLIFGVGSGVLYELCFPLSLALAYDARETIEIGMVNYLWPAFTVLFAVLFNGQKARWWIWVGMPIAFLGICIVLSGDAGFNISSTVQRIIVHPAGYGIAFLGAVLWAGYSSITKAFNPKENPVVIVFLLNALVFGLGYALGYGPRYSVTWDSMRYVLLAAAVMGVGYATWNVGVIKGRIAVLGIASYFTPVLSCVFASVWLDVALTATFYSGVFLVVLGSFICWHATLGKF